MVQSFVEVLWKILKFEVVGFENESELLNSINQRLRMECWFAKWQRNFSVLTSAVSLEKQHQKHWQSILFIKLKIASFNHRFSYTNISFKLHWCHAWQRYCHHKLEIKSQWKSIFPPIWSDSIFLLEYYVNSVGKAVATSEWIPLWITKLKKLWEKENMLNFYEGRDLEHM